MIDLELGENEFYLMVEQNRTITDPDYVFVFVSDLTNQKIACGASGDLVDDFWTQFNVTVQASGEDPLLSQIALPHYGEYHYSVFEVEDMNDFDFDNIDTTDIRDLTGLLTEGKMKYFPPASTDNYYKDVSGSRKAYGE